ncbi:MAG TPA: hypothetical protein ENI07_02885, partial [Desulfobacterales bacterium]|nr:hypothetical protein [Desulfobacterales bacterium]
IVMAPGSLGELGILIGHTPFLTTLKLGSASRNPPLTYTNRSVPSTSL